MNADLDCLSILELLDLRSGGGDASERAHLDACPRCRALLATVPADITLTEPTGVPPAPPANAARRQRAGAISVQTGAVWRAVGEGADIAWVVVVIGRAPGGNDHVMVVPVFGEPTLATEQDLILEPSVLGYRAFADMGNSGVLLREQLVEPLATLDGPAAHVLAALYRAIVGGEPAPESESVGPAVFGERDPRLSAANERRLVLRGLWRRADRLVDAEQPDEAAQQAHGLTEIAAAAATRATPEGAGVAVILGAHLGADAEWDRATLLEASRADGRWLDAFSADQLDLTDRRDVEDLARIFFTLGVDMDVAEPAIVYSLERSAGGLRTAEGPPMPMAARSQPGMAEDEVTESLYADQSSVDQSPAGREAAIAQYLADFFKALQDLE